jgi:hypothetical protein
MRALSLLIRNYYYFYYAYTKHTYEELTRTLSMLIRNEMMPFSPQK